LGNAVVVSSGDSVIVLVLVVERVTEENDDSELLDAILDFEHRDNDNDDVSVRSIEDVGVGRTLSVCDSIVDEGVATVVWIRDDDAAALAEKEPLPEERGVTE
jgi:hypothetical protein